MIDLHCHLLPAVDDGPADLGGSLRLAQAQLAAGVRTVAVTPHAVARFPNDAATVARGLLEMRTALRAAKMPLELLGGAELDLAHALQLPDDELAGLALGGGRWLLLEAPLTPVAPLETGVAALRARGFEILLAHPERSPLLQSQPAAVSRLVRGGARMQLTAGGLSGQFGRTARRFGLQLADEGLVHVFSSDAHDESHRPPGLLGPLEEAGLGAYAQLLCQEHPAALLEGAPLPETVVLKRRRGGWINSLRR